MDGGIPVSPRFSSTRLNRPRARLVIPSLPSASSHLLLSGRPTPHKVSELGHRVAQLQQHSAELQQRVQQALQLRRSRSHERPVRETPLTPHGDSKVEDGTVLGNGRAVGATLISESGDRGRNDVQLQEASSDGVQVSGLALHTLALGTPLTPVFARSLPALMCWPCAGLVHA